MKVIVNKVLRNGDLQWKYHPLNNLKNDNDVGKFDTSNLNFDLNHPVDILTQISYDDSVNLILNDGKNPPKLINTRFSPKENNKYEIFDRAGLSDTNIYNSDLQNTLLQKTTNAIAKLEYLGDFKGGSLPVGNYHFYFRLMDADGNLTDIIAESRMIHLFIGEIPGNIHGGIMNEDSNKLIKFKLSNLDSSYPYVKIYYTRSTSVENQQANEFVYQITKNYTIDENNECNIIISGKEPILEYTKEEINLQTTYFNSVKAQTICQNRLFFGNVNTEKLDYLELQDLALRITINQNNKSYRGHYIDSNYTISEENLKNSYWNSKFISEKTGYWPGEYYRFGIVFILNNFQLSEVFNIAGNDLSKQPIDRQENILSTVKDQEDVRIYLKFDGNNIVGTQYNNKGIYKFKDNEFKIIGLDLNIPDNVKNKLKELGIQGYFLVRQKRIPTTLCQAITIPTSIDYHIPLTFDNKLELLTKTGAHYFPNLTDEDKDKFKKELNEIYGHIESWDEDDSWKEKIVVLNDKNINTTDLSNDSNSNKSKINAAICPDFEINQEYYNNFFCGEEYKLEFSNYQPQNFNDSDKNQYSLNKYNKEKINSINSKIIGIPDNTKLIVLDDVKYSSRLGEAEIPYEGAIFFTTRDDGKIVNIANMNIARGCFGPYLGLPNLTNIKSNKIFNIKIKESEFDFEIRANDESEYFAISDRRLLEEDNSIIYGGDCYICQFSHRLNRNFNSTSAPYNDIIVDRFTWIRNFDAEVDEDKNLIINYEQSSKINVGDLNAVKLGIWLTFTLRSSINLNIRSLDSRNVEETITTGHPKGFYPYHGLNTEGVYKHSDSFIFNKGQNNLLGSKYYYNFPDVPFIKNNFDTRIYYSEVHANDSFQNGFRNFKSTSFKDYPKTYGAITKLLELKGNIICIFEHGIGLIPVNERSIAGESDGGFIYVNTDNILPLNPKIISDQYGSKWPNSILKTESFIYGVDTVAKKIWKTDGSSIECISDFTVQEFLNKNITLGENDHIPNLNPYARKDVRTFYNAFKQDILFTFCEGTTEWNLCYNESMKKFITFYDWIPSLMNNIDNSTFSISNDNKIIYKHGFTNLATTKNPLPTYWYDKQYPFEFEFIVANEPSLHKLFYNIELIANKAEPESFKYEVIGESYDFTKDKPNMYYKQEKLKWINSNVNYGELQDKSADLVKEFDSAHRIIKGSELVYYPDRFEYRIQNTCPIQLLEKNPFNGNCRYLEDRWKIHINPIKVRYKNEIKHPLIPAGNYPNLFNDLTTLDKDQYDIEKWKCVRELDPKDKFIKIRIRYSGKDLALINFIQTFYNISYG